MRPRWASGGALRLGVVGLALAVCARAAEADAGPGPPALADLTARARALRLEADPGWIRLGHWHRRLSGGWKSEVDGRGFFLAPAGRRDPAAELEATLAGFLDDRPRDDELDDAQCRFPARLAFLASRLDLSGLPRRGCPRLEDFLSRLRPQGVTVVFSSYYLNNPSSAFGHTLLRLDKAPEALSGRHELLDYGVDYAATTDTRNALVYAVKGLFGGFQGQFKAYAYYYKVRQYADAESRDLWEYDLDLAPAEVALLTAHLWELGGTTLRYWYLDRNCSYEVLAALEGAAPRLHLLEHLGPAVVLPSDTVRALFRNPGLVRAVHYRPSIQTQFETRARRLSRVDAAPVERLSRDPAAPLAAGLSDERRAAVLDAALDLVDVRHARGLLLGTDPEGARIRQELLLRRAAIPVASPPLEVPVPEAARPDRGHGSLRLGAGAAAGEGGGALLLDLRLALHDLADPTRGYPSGMQIEFLPVRLRIPTRAPRVELEDGSLVKIISLAPVNRFELRPSWRARIGVTTVRDRGCGGCNAFIAQLGGGLASGHLLGGLDLLATADAEVLAAPGLSGMGGSGWRPGVGPSLLARIQLGDRLTALAEAGWRVLPGARPGTTWLAGGTIRLHLSEAASLSLEGRATPAGTELAMLGLGYF